MSSRNVGIPVQAPVHDVLLRIEEQSGCIAWDVYDCVTLEQILSVARKVAAQPQDATELGTTGNTGSPKLPGWVEVRNHCYDWTCQQECSGNYPLPVDILKVGYEFIARQLRAGA
jgi:hypothetical protein